MPIRVPDQYDLCIIGCGPAGFAAAIRALDLGRHVCVVEGGQIGGAGVMWGALASKTMWELAKDYAVAAKVDRGYRASGLTVDYRAVRNTVIQAVKEKQYQMLSQLETFSPRRWDGPGSISFKRGYGAFSGEGKLQVTYRDGRCEEVRADHFLIATGSSPKLFPHIPLKAPQVITSNSILQLAQFPKRLMIIGAGITGSEYATIFSNFGQTKVYLVDHKERIIPFEDEDISEFVSTNLEQNEVEIFHSAHLRDIINHADCLEVILDFDDGHSKVVEADVVLISIGRLPNLGDLNLARLGIASDSRGYLQVDTDCRVKERIYAAGDVTHQPALVNVAEMEGRHAVNHMFGIKQLPLNYRNMSTVMFFYPAVAAVGLNETDCRRQAIAYRVAHYANALLSRSIAMRAMEGFVKIIVSDDDEQRILGMRATGAQVSSTIMSIALLMDQGKGVRDVIKTVHPHPTMSEGIQECLRLLIGDSVYKPLAFPDQIKIWTWHPRQDSAAVAVRASQL